MPSGTPTAAPTIAPVCEDPFVSASVDALDEGIEAVVLDVPVAPDEAALDVLLVPDSAKRVPNVGTYTESVPQQFVLLYAQHHDPPVTAALHAITFTNVLFPAASQVSVCHSPHFLDLGNHTVCIRQAIIWATRVEPSTICTSASVMISL
jgi:hypothetical protein